MIKEITTVIKEVKFGRNYTFICEDGTYTISAADAISQSRFNPVEVGKKMLLVLLGDEIISYKNA